jgi:AraC-like DNA-binding protein
MRPARTVRDFVRDPVGRYSLGPTHVVWCHSATLCGSVHWGRPGEADAQELAARLELTVHPELAGGFDAIMDARAMESFAWPTFSVLSQYVSSRLETWGQRIRRHAIVVPPGAVGAFVAGLLPLLGPRHALRFFGSVDEAFAFLDRAELPAVLDEVTQIADGLRGMSPLIRALHAYLDQSLGGASIERAARGCGVSPRTLQRQLAALGTQFTRELMRARVRAACAQLEHSDDKVEVIALRVGCSSSSQLAAVFRRHIGETPAQYRQRTRHG